MNDSSRCPMCDRETVAWWQSRAIKAEALTKDLGARVLAAEAERSEIVSLVSPSSDQSLPDAVRELCEHAEELRLAAAQWAKVAPLIERLADDVRRRELIARAEFDRRVSDTVTALLAATEATP